MIKQIILHTKTKTLFLINQSQTAFFTIEGIIIFNNHNVLKEKKNIYKRNTYQHVKFDVQLQKTIVKLTLLFRFMTALK